MSFDRRVLAAAIAAHGPVARIVVAATAGSIPREAGAAMLVWADGQSGTIGGGALEFDAVRTARAALATRDNRLARVPLGPGLGQCCGGAVTLLTEVWTAERLAEAAGDTVARPVPGGMQDMPLAVRRHLRALRNGTRRPAPFLKDGWFVEPVTRPERTIWVWGAGHVGRAIVGVLAPLPGLSITWVDTAADRFPAAIPPGVTVRVAARPGDIVADAPRTAEHLVLTFSHALDLELCHRLLGHGFASCGLIGSATKAARFRSRLRALGHGDASISRIRCPIGEPRLGKHPQAIAVGVAHDILAAGVSDAARGEGTG